MITDEQLEERIRQVFSSVATTRLVHRTLTTRHPAHRIGRIVAVGFGIAVTAAAVGLVLAYGPRSTQVPGPGGPSSIRSPALTITSSTGLRNGQVIEVHVSGFSIGEKVFLSECGSESDANDAGCGQQLAAQPFLVTNAKRNGSGTFRVTTVAGTRPYDMQGNVPCTNSCVLVATGGVGLAFASTPLTFVSPVPTTTAPPTTTTPQQALPPLNFGTLPVPSDYTCSAGLYILSPGNEAAGECVPYAYLVGGTVSVPNNNTACPAGSFMTMGPVECENASGNVTPVPPGPNTCSTPGGPCPSSTLPLSSQASVIAWSAIEFPIGKCPAGYYFGETNGIATCVPYDYLPGGTSANPNNNTACPASSGLKVAKLTGTLCTQDAEPNEIVAPTSSTTTTLSATAGPLSAVSTPRSGVPAHVTIRATATFTGIPAAETGQLEFDVSPGPYNQGQPAPAEAVPTHGPGVYSMPTGYALYRVGNWFVTVFYEPSPSQGTGPVPTVSGMPSSDNPHPDANLVTVVTAT
jgi:hypothetical protein